MTDRTTKVTLTAQVSNYLAGMDQAQKKTAQFATGSSQKLAAQRQAMTTLGTAMLAIGAAAAAGVGLAIKTFADFDAEMAQVKSLSHATADEMSGLTNAALTVGQEFGYSATQVAQAETELVKAGISVKDIMGGALTGALTLAADGQMDVADATQIAAEAMTQFGLTGKDVPHIADLLAAGADKALGSVGDLGQALESGGLVAHQFGLSIEDTTGTLAAFAQAGLIGETAGTDLRQMLLKLGNPSADAAATMKDLGISLYDASGQFVGITNLSGQLNDKLGKTAVQSGKVTEAQKNQALATIFGSRAIAGANVLVDQGAKGISNWINKVNDQGFAADQAKGKLDSLEGDIKKLGAAFQTDLIKSGSTSNDVLRSVTQTVTNLVTAFGTLPAPAQGAILAVGAIVAAVGLLGGGALTVIPKLAQMRNALNDLSISMRTVGLAGGAVGLAITVLVSVLATVANSQAQAKQAAQDLADTYDKQTGAITKNTRAFVADKLQKDGTLQSAKAIGLAEKDVVDAYLQQPKALAKVKDALDATKDPSSAHVKALIKAGASADDLINSYKDLNSVLTDGKRDTDASKERWSELSAATDTNKASTDDASTAYLNASKNASSLDDELSNLIDTINKANGVGQDAVSANSAYQDSLAKVQDTITKAKAGTEGYSTSLDESTAAGADNAEMFNDLAKKSQDSAKAQFDLDHNTQNYIANLQTGRQTLYNNILALTGNATAAQTLTDKIFAMPSQKEINILADTSKAQSNIDTFVNTNDGRVVHVLVRVDGNTGAFIPGLGNVAEANGGVVDYYATGGTRESHTAQIAPAGSMRIWAEPETGGESYIPLATSKRTRSLQIWQETGKRLGVQGFADGYVTPTYVPAPQQYGSSSSVNVSPQVSLKGATLLMSVDGRQFTAVIQDQIVAADQRAVRHTKMTR